MSPYQYNLDTKKSEASPRIHPLWNIGSKAVLLAGTVPSWSALVAGWPFRVRPPECKRQRRW